MITDSISLLKYEHAVLRVRLQSILQCLDTQQGWKMLEELHNFVVNWHARIEDKYVFPVLEDKGINLRPLSNDHLLIEKYGNSVLRERRRDWAERYAKIVMDHNLNEEKLFPPRLDNVEVMKAILHEMRGFKGYFEFSGLDEYDLTL